jgi:predicted site-specific integrase-resolvase
MKKSNSTTAIYSREQTASLLSISFPTLRKWTKKGILKCYQLGGRIYYRHDEIIKALKPIEIYTTNIKF